MTLAAVNRLLHHVIIFDMNVKSSRWEEALERQRDGGC
jgi:hypothetical protein